MILTIILYGLILLVSTGVWLASLALFVATRRHSVKWKRRLGAAPFTALTLLVFAAFGFGGYSAVPQINRGALWSQEFGFDPPADVRDLQSSSTLR